MTIILSKNNKPDSRMVEYDQLIVRLGLEKNTLQAEIDGLRSVVSEISLRRSTLLLEVTAIEDKIKSIQQELVDVIKKSSEEVSGLTVARQRSTQEITEKNSELKQLESYLVSAKERITKGDEALSVINEKARVVRELLDSTRKDLVQTLAQKQIIERDIISLQEVKQELRDSVAANEKRAEYLAEKEQFLNRKEADLFKYEQRVEKMRESVGNRIKMIFK
jgi:chromosome segregation ATPase